MFSGLSNIEISEKLNISENTVESHFTSIYNKLTVNNKIELFNIAKKYKKFNLKDSHVDTRYKLVYNFIKC
jgi:DNA-binding NarL/FixJ family response regulator